MSGRVTALFDRRVLSNDPRRRAPITRLLQAAVEAVEPGRCVRQHLRRSGSDLSLGNWHTDLAGIRSVLVLAIGKAAPAMATATIEILEGVPASALVVTNHDAPVPANTTLMRAGHPLPDERSEAAAREALRRVDELTAADMVICLISGGGSALFEAPAPGLELSDARATVVELLGCGAPIEEVNTVRIQLSAVKGGRLAEAIAPATLVTLILSDVVGNPLDVIASGPTVAARTGSADALQVLEKYGLTERVPKAVRRHLESNVTTDATGPVSPGPAEIIGDGAAAAEALRAAAESYELEARVVSTSLTGESREVVEPCLQQAGGGITIFTGETTVTRPGRGTGGRNQEAALAAALRLAGDGAAVFAALATDGVDGPTDAAGAIVDGGTIARGERAGLEGARHLDEHDSHPFLRATGDVLTSGPTGTNVGDVWLVWRD